MKHYIRNKAHLVVIALLFLGNSLFAGEGSGSGSRQRRVNRSGFVGPVLHLAARAMEGVVARQEEDVTTEGIHTGERKMEEPEAAESEAPEGDEGLPSLGDLPPEVIVYHVIPHLGDRELGRLALTSHWAAELVREELEKRYTSHIQRTEQRIHELAQFASSLNFLVRSQAAREMGKLLASPETLITREQVEAVLTLLIGDDNDGGLAEDRDAEVRSNVAQAIGIILSSGKLGEDVHVRLLTVLIGENEVHEDEGLAGDPDTSILRQVAQAIGAILASRICSEDERLKLLRVLIGDDEHEGLVSHERDWVVKHVVEVIRTMLASGMCSDEERSRLVDALIGSGGLIGNASIWVRISVVEAIGAILPSGKCGKDEHSKLLDALDRLTKDPDPHVRNKALNVKEAIHLRENPRELQNLWSQRELISIAMNLKV